VHQQVFGKIGDLENHCHSFFWRTGFPQRQHMPASTCSLASTVWQGSHQFT
jgi:hypothetical protein